MSKSGGHKGYVLSRRPKQYKQTGQQKIFQEALEYCGIEKGISKYDLQIKMRDCIPEFYKRRRQGEG